MKCPKCHREGLYKIKSGNYKCPWLDCKKESSAIKVKEHVKREVLTKTNKVEDKYYSLSCILAYAKSPDPQRDEAVQKVMNCFLRQRFKDFELIVVEFAKDGKGKFPYVSLVDKYIVLKDDRPMNKSWLMNCGARVASTNNLIFHDADVLFGKNFLEKVNDFRKTHKLFSCWSSFRCMPGRDNPYMRIHVSKTISCLIGAFFCQKNYYFDTFGGYNEDYFGYGREDSDIWHRATHLLGRIPFMDYPLVHHYHNWHPQNGPNPLDRNDQRADAILEKCMKYPQKIIDLLIKTNIGNKEHPTLIHSMKYGVDK